MKQSTCVVFVKLLRFTSHMSKRGVTIMFLCLNVHTGDLFARLSEQSMFCWGNSILPIKDSAEGWETTPDSTPPSQHCARKFTKSRAKLCPAEQLRSKGKQIEMLWRYWQSFLTVILILADMVLIGFPLMPKRMVLCPKNRPKAPKIVCVIVVINRYTSKILG